MDFLNHLLASDGCNVDGTATSNPFTSFVEQVFEHHIPSFSNGFETDSSTILMENDMRNNQMSIFMLQESQQQQQQIPDWDRSGLMNQFPPYMAYYPNVYQQQVQYPVESTLSTSNEFDDHPQQQQQITIDNVTNANFEGWQAVANDINDDISNSGPSQQGYDQAWSDLSARLSSGALGSESDTLQQQYEFSTSNPYCNNTLLNDIANQAMDLYNRGRIQEAILAFESAIQAHQQLNNSSDVEENSDVSEEESWRMLGICHAENDDDKKAILCFLRALDCDPYNLRALLALGTSYVNELDSVRALETLRSWVAHNPRYQGLNVVADEYSDGTLMDEVMQLMLLVDDYNKDSSTDTDVQVVLGVLYNVSLDYNSAIDCFAKACAATNNTDYSLMNKLAASYANGGRSEEAIPLYAKALALRPFYARGWLNLGISYANLNKHEDAAKSYLQALHLSPDARHIWNYLRVVLSFMDRMDLVELTSKENTYPIAQQLNLELIRPS